MDPHAVELPVAVVTGPPAGGADRPVAVEGAEADVLGQDRPPGGRFHGRLLAVEVAVLTEAVPYRGEPGCAGRLPVVGPEAPHLQLHGVTLARNRHPSGCRQPADGAHVDLLRVQLAQRGDDDPLPGAADVAPEHDRGLRRTVLEQHVTGRADLPRPGPRAWVVDRDRQVRRGHGTQPVRDHVPRLEPVGQRDHRVVVPQRGTDGGRHGLRRGHAGQHPDRDVAVLRLRGHLQDGGGHREHPRVPGRDDRDPPPGRGQVQRVRGPLGLDAVVRGVPGLARVRRHPVQVGAVPDEVVRRGQRRGDLRGQPVPPGGTGPDHDDLTRPAHRPLLGRRASGLHDGRDGLLGHRGGDLTGDQGDREVGHVRGVHIGQRAGPLALHRGPFDVAGAVEHAGVGHRPTDRGEGAPELHHRRRVGAREPPRELLAGQRARQHGEHLVALHQWLTDRRGGTADRRHARYDLGPVAVGQPLVHVHVGAVEERVALGEEDDVAAGVEVRGQPGGGRGVELVDRALVAAGVVGGLGGDRVDQRLLDRGAAQVRLGDPPRDGASVAGGVVGDHVRVADEAGGLDRGQLRVAGTETDARVQGGGGDRGPAAAAVHDEELQVGPLGEGGLGLGGADEPHRDADDRGRAGCVAAVDEVQHVEQRGRGVPDREHRALEAVGEQLQRGRGPGVADPARVVGHPGVAQQAEHLVVRGQPGGGHPGGDHHRVAEDGGTGPQRGACGCDDAVGGGDVVDEVDLAAGVDHADGDVVDAGREPGEVGLRADRRERAAVDLVAVGRAHGHARRPGTSRSPAIRRRRSPAARGARVDDESRPGQPVGGTGCRGGQHEGAPRGDQQPGASPASTSSCAAESCPSRGATPSAPPSDTPTSTFPPSARRERADRPPVSPADRAPGPGAGIVLRPESRAGIPVAAPGSSAARQARAAGSALWAARRSRNAAAASSSSSGASAGGQERPVVSPATTSSPPSEPRARQHRSGRSAATSPRPSSRANRNRPGSADSVGRAHRPRSSTVARPRTSARPPSIPDRGEASTLRTRSWVLDGSSPAAVSRSTGRGSAGSRPRSCRFPREVRWTAPSPASRASAATARSAAAVTVPPGSRTRARAPSAAACGETTPGQASARVRVVGDGTPDTVGIHDRWGDPPGAAVTPRQVFRSRQVPAGTGVGRVEPHRGHPDRGGRVEGLDHRAVAGVHRDVRRRGVPEQQVTGTQVGGVVDRAPAAGLVGGVPPDGDPVQGVGQPGQPRAVRAEPGTPAPQVGAVQEQPRGRDQTLSGRGGRGPSAQLTRRQPRLVAAGQRDPDRVARLADDRQPGAHADLAQPFGACRVAVQPGRRDPVDGAGGRPRGERTERGVVDELGRGDPAGVAAAVLARRLAGHDDPRPPVAALGHGHRGAEQRLGLGPRGGAEHRGEQDGQDTGHGGDSRQPDGPGQAATPPGHHDGWSGPAHTGGFSWCGAPPPDHRRRRDGAGPAPCRLRCGLTHPGRDGDARAVRVPAARAEPRRAGAGLQLLGRRPVHEHDGPQLLEGRRDAAPRADRLRRADPEDHRDPVRALRHLRHRRDLRAGRAAVRLDREAATARRPRRPVPRGVRPGPAEPGDAGGAVLRREALRAADHGPAVHARLPPRRVRPARPGPTPDLRRAARGRGPGTARRRDPLPAGAATARERRHRHRLRRRARLAGHRLRRPRDRPPELHHPGRGAGVHRAAVAAAVHGPAGDDVRPARGAAADVQRLRGDRDHVQRPDVRPGPGAQQPLLPGVRVRPAAVGRRWRRALQLAVGRRLGDPGQHRGRPGPAVPVPGRVGGTGVGARGGAGGVPVAAGQRDAGQQPLRAGTAGGAGEGPAARAVPVDLAHLGRDAAGGGRRAGRTGPGGAGTAADAGHRHGDRRRVPGRGLSGPPCPASCHGRSPTRSRGPARPGRGGHGLGDAAHDLRGRHGRGPALRPRARRVHRHRPARAPRRARPGRRRAARGPARGAGRGCGADPSVRRDAAGAAAGLRVRGAARGGLRAAPRPGRERRRLPARRPVPAAGQRVHDRRGGRGGGCAERRRCHPALAGRASAPGGALRGTHQRGRRRVRRRRGAGARRDGVRAARRDPGRHDRRRGQRLRGRGQASALRAGGHRRAGRAVGGRRDRRRHRRRRDRRRGPAGPGRARADLPGVAGHDLRAAGRGGPAGDREAARGPRDRRDRRGRLARPRHGVPRPGPRGRRPGDGHLGPRAPRGDRRGPGLVAGPAAQLRLAVPRPALHGGLRRQGHVRHQPRAADDPGRALHRRTVGGRVPQAADLPAGDPRGDPRPGRADRDRVRLRAARRAPRQRPHPARRAPGLTAHAYVHRRCGSGPWQPPARGRAGPRRGAAAGRMRRRVADPRRHRHARPVRLPTATVVGGRQRPGLQLLGDRPVHQLDGAELFARRGRAAPRAGRLRGPGPEDDRDAGRPLRHLRHPRDLRLRRPAAGRDRQAPPARRPGGPLRRAVRPGPAQPGDARGDVLRRHPLRHPDAGPDVRHGLPPRRVRPPRADAAAHLRRAAAGVRADPARRRHPLPAGAAAAGELGPRHRLRRRAGFAGHRLRGPAHRSPELRHPAGRRGVRAAALARALHGPAGDHVRPARGAAADVQRLGRDRDHVQRPDEGPHRGGQQPVRRGLRVRPAAVGGRRRRPLQHAVGRRLGDPGEHRCRQGPAVPPRRRLGRAGVVEGRGARRLPGPGRHGDPGQQPVRAGPAGVDREGLPTGALPVDLTDQQRDPPGRRRRAGRPDDDPGRSAADAGDRDRDRRRARVPGTGLPEPAGDARPAAVPALQDRGVEPAAGQLRRTRHLPRPGQLRPGPVRPAARAGGAVHRRPDRRRRRRPAGRGLPARRAGQRARPVPPLGARRAPGVLRRAQRRRRDDVLLVVRRELRRRGQLPDHRAHRGRDPLVHRAVGEPGDDRSQHGLVHAAVRHAGDPRRAAGRPGGDRRGRPDRRRHRLAGALARDRAQHPGRPHLRLDHLDHGRAADVRPARPALAAGGADRQRVDHALHLQHRLPGRRAAAGARQRDQRAAHRPDRAAALPVHPGHGQGGPPVSSVQTAPPATTPGPSDDTGPAPARRRPRGRTVLVGGLLLVICWVMLSPVLWTAMSVTKPTDVAFLDPPVFTWEPTFTAFVDLWQTTEFYRYLLNTLVVALISTVIALLIGIPAAYALSRYPGWVSVALLIAALIFRALPRFAVVLPMYELSRSLGIYDTTFAVAAALVAINQPFSIWLLRNFFAEIPKELDEAAMIDGCTRFQTLRRVMVPLMGPGILTAGSSCSCSRSRST
ncbi:hypothetical protein L7F22_032219 [Adiantum nelumboides]|nr:hypothetical protein [Adiantum nelumboides]